MGFVDVMKTLLTLPPHLLKRIRELLHADIHLPDNLTDDLDQAVRDAQQYPLPQNALEGDSGGDTETEEPASVTSGPRPEVPTIDLSVLETLAKWADTKGGRRKLQFKRLDAGDYGLIALLVGTEVYMPAKQRENLLSAQNPDHPIPFLPSYLSPAPPSFGSEYRALTRQLATVLNVLFSIFGCAGAVFVASTSGAGYSRETAVVLAILAGVVVGLADGVLVWIVSSRSDKERKARRLRGIEASKGTAGLGPLEIEDRDDGDTRLGPVGVDERPAGKETEQAEPIRKSIRLRRKQLHGDENS